MLLGLSRNGPQVSLNGVFKMESIRKLSNFNFQWTKTFCQDDLNDVAFCFVFLRAIEWCNYVITPIERNILWEFEQINVKFHQVTSYVTFSEFYLRFHNSCEIWRLFSGDPMRNNLSLVLLQITNYICKPLRNVEKNAHVLFKLFQYKVFVHWKLNRLWILS